MTTKPSSGKLQGPILVAGGAGYIGSHTVRALQERGVEVIVVDDLSTGHAESVKGPGVRLATTNLGDREGLRKVFREHRPRSVVHFAAKCYVGESMEEPAKYYLENVHHTWCLLEEMRQAECKQVVFSSTCATYGDPVEVPLTEAHRQQPISTYGKTKLHMEHMMQDYERAYGFRCAALRYFNAAGAAQDGTLGEHHEPETHLIPLVLQVAQGKRAEILIFGDDYDTPDGTCIRDYVHVEDLARAHLAALERLQAGASGIACNLGTGRGYSVLEMIETARRVTGQPIPARVVERRPGDPPELVSGGEMAQESLGWQPLRAQLEDIVADAWRFMQAHPDGYGS